MVNRYRLTILALLSFFLGFSPLQKVWGCYTANPTADIEVDCGGGNYLYACTDAEIIFDGTDSHDNDEYEQYIVSYEWTIKQGETTVDQYGPSGSPTQPYTFDAAGTYTVTLKVMDDESQWNTKTVTVYVGDAELEDCYVDDDGSDTTGDGSVNYPFATIQHAIKMVCSGATIHIAEGTYDEDLRLYGRSDLTLEGPAPANWCDLSATVEGWIDIYECEPNCHLKYIEFDSTGKSYGIRCCADDLLVERCRVHSAYYGLYVLHADDLEVKESLVYDNTYGLVFGYGDSFIIKNNVVYGNSSYGINFGYEQNTEIINNTVVDNGTYGINKVGTSAPAIYNCILWGNADDLNNCTANYSCIEHPGDVGAGTGDITDDPEFVNASIYDYHLELGSPCIDAGCPPSGPYGEYEIEPDPDGGNVNMGAYGNTLEATVSSSTQWTLTMSVSPTGAGTTDPAIGEHQYPDNTPVGVTAYPEVGWEFHEWTGPVANTQDNPTTITMTDDFSVCAWFKIDSPDNLTATPGDKEVVLEWDASEAADRDHYEIHRSETDGFAPEIGTCIDNVGAAYTTYLDTTGLVNGTTYFYKVIAVDGSSNKSSPSNQASAMPEDTMAPSALSLQAFPGDGQVNLTWEPSDAPDLDHYKLYRSVQANFVPGPSNILDDTISASQVSYLDATAANRTRYYYLITACDDDSNESDPSNKASAMPLDVTAPAQPVGVVAAANGCGTIEVSWDANTETDLVGYHVYRADSITGPFGAPLETGVLSDPCYMDQDIPRDGDSRTWCYAVSAHDDDGNESPKTVVAITPTFPVVNRTQNTRHCTIQEAIDQSYEGDLIEVSAGTYPEHLLINKKITLTSTNLCDPSTAIIDGSHSGTVITLTSGAAGTHIIGFTIENGNGTNGGGVHNNGAFPVFTQCIIKDCGVNGGHGAGAYNTAGTLRFVECSFIDNIAYMGGGAIAGASGAVELFACELDGNISQDGGAAILGTSLYLDIRECLFTNNVTSSFGGSAIYGGDGQVRYTKFMQNNSTDRGVVTNSQVDLFNCVITNNTISNINSVDAAAMQDCSGDIINCTITNNATNRQINGLINCTGVIANSIIYGNGDGSLAELSGCAPVYCCIRNWTGGTGNISPASSPVQADGYHLDAVDGEDCINAGNDCYVPAGIKEDMDGDRRIFSVGVEMGADEVGDIIYVDAQQDNGVFGGTSWYDAYKYLQNALAAASPGDEIWAAEGTYYPDESADGGTGNPIDTDDRSASFVLAEDVAVYGGFAGDEIDLDERDLEKYPAILSGDIDKDDNGLPHTENSYHVVTGAANALLDGCTIQNGYADGTGHKNGGGMLNSGDSCCIRKCVFVCNYAAEKGGGVYNSGAYTSFENCLFAGNAVTTGTNVGQGGAIYNSGAGVTFVNCTVSNNIAYTTGGIYDNNNSVTSSTMLLNCIFWDNRDKDGTTTTSLTQVNDVLEPLSASYCCIQGGWTGTGNIGEDEVVHYPVFVKPGHWEDFGATQSDSLLLLATVRDFRAYHIYNTYAAANPDEYRRNPNGGHIDFQNIPIYNAGTQQNPDWQMGWEATGEIESGIVGPLGSLLGIDGKPVYALGATGENPESGKDYTHGEAAFNQWYNTEEGVNLETDVCLELTSDGLGKYTFSKANYFPVDNWGFGPEITDQQDHNYHWTLELHTEFYYAGDDLFFEVVAADDDMFIYIDGKLVVDIGGVHSERVRFLTIENGQAKYWNGHDTQYNGVGLIETINLNLVSGNKYNFDLFYAERHTTLSHLQFSTTIPLETNFTLGDYHLRLESPCIDAADNDSLPCLTKDDLDGLPRRVDVPEVTDSGNGTAPIVDMGAYEYQVETEIDPIEVYAGVDKVVSVDRAQVVLFDAAVTGGIVADRTSEWYVEYAPIGCTVVFDPGSINEANPTVYLGVDRRLFEVQDSVEFVLGLEAQDGVSYDADTVVITVQPGMVESRLEVDAGPDGGGETFTDIPLDGAVTLYNLQIGDIRTEWSVVSRSVGGIYYPPGEVEFDDSSAEDTTVRFSLPGTYVLKLWGGNGNVEDEDMTEVIVSANTNAPPLANAGADAFLNLSTSTTLAINDATVKDDVPQASLDYTWTIIGPAGGATLSQTGGSISSPTAGQQYPANISNITFAKTGVYTFRLTADDGQFTHFNDKVITVVKLPEVEAGENKVVTLTQQTDGTYAATVGLLDAWVREYTFPENVQIAWSQDASNPTQLTFNTNEVNPTLTFTAADLNAVDTVKGVYKFTLTAEDDDLLPDPCSASDDVWITVVPDITIQPPTKKSVYGITDHGWYFADRISAFDIQEGMIAWQKNYDILGYPDSLEGPVGLAITPDSKYLFVTFEFIGGVELIDPASMESGGDYTPAPQATDLAGIVFDQDKQKLYTVDRSTNNLYVYFWDDDEKQLMLYEQVELPVISSACGLALDEEDDILYVSLINSHSPISNSIYRFSTDDWSYIDEINTGSYAVGLDLYRDSEGKKYLYTSAYEYAGPGNHNLVRTLINADNIVVESIAKYIGAQGIGIGVDKTTGYVYVTTSDNQLRVYNGLLINSLWQTEGPTDYYAHPTDDDPANEVYISGPADIVVGGNVAYKYPIGTLTKTKTSGPATVSLGDQITYELIYNIQYNAGDPTGISKNTYVIDELPRGVDFISASHQAIYNPQGHIVTWYLGDLAEGANNNSPGEELTLVVQVNQFAQPGGTVINQAIIESYARKAMSAPVETPVAWWGLDEVERIYVDQKRKGGCGASWETAYNSFKDALSRARQTGSAVKEIWVAAGYAPYFVDNVATTFKMAENVKVYGGFYGVETNLNERDLSAFDSQTILSGSGETAYVITGASNAVLDGFTITGGDDAGVYCDDAMTDFVVRNCKIVGNNGLGIYCGDDSSTAGSVQIINNWICENANEYYYYYNSGIYLYSYDGAVEIRNNTVAYNTDFYGYYGYGIYRNGGSAPTVKNCISWGNRGYYNADELYNAGTNVTYCCVEGGYASGSDIITDDPCFVNPLGDYHLLGTSPCINAGDNGDINEDELDIDDDPRIIGENVDIGADETPAIQVEAGENRVLTLPFVSEGTASVTVTLSDANLTVIDEGSVSVDYLSVHWWEYDFGSHTKGLPVDFISPATALNPTLSFSQFGYHAYILGVYDTTDTIDDTTAYKGMDFVTVQVNLGVQLTSDPATVVLPDDATLNVSYYSGYANLTDDDAIIGDVEFYGPEDAVTFGTIITHNESTNTASVDVTFDAGPGKYEFLCVIYDNNNYIIGEKRIWVPVNPQGITVQAEATPTEITLPTNRVFLNGSISGGVPHTTMWEVGEEAVDLVAIGDPGSMHTWIDFAEPGEYEIALVARDVWDNVIGVDIVTVTVNPPDYGSLVVDAGPDQEITLPDDYVFLTGSVTGGGGTLTYKWICDGPVTFTPSSADQLAVKAVFAQAGVYELGLVVRNSSNEVVGVDTVTVTVNHPQITINAGEDQTVPFGATVTLSGQINGAGWSQVQWIDPSGGHIMFSPDSFGLVRSATFDQPGVYEIGLVALNAGNEVLAADTVLITVEYRTVQLDAGADREIILSDSPWNNRVNLQGRILAGEPASVQWLLPVNDAEEVVSGICNHGALTGLQTWLEFIEPGIYVVGLAAFDQYDNVVGWDTLTITVYPQEQSVQVDLVSSEYSVILDKETSQVTVHLTGTVTSGSGNDEPEWVGPTNAMGMYAFSNMLETYPTYTADVTFYESGVYELGLVMHDVEGYVIGFDKVTIAVSEWVPYHITYPKELWLSSGQASGNLHGEVSSGTYYLQWVDHTGEAVINPVNSGGLAAQLDSTATFDQAGKYIIDFVVREGSSAGNILGVLTATTIVHPEGYSTYSANAGVDREIDLDESGSVTITLDGGVTGAGASAHWMAPQGAPVTFDPDVWTEDPAVTFSAPGEYHLTLMASNGNHDPALEQIYATDKVIIIVNGFNYGEEYYVDAGEDQTINLLVSNQAELNGEAHGDYISRVEWVAPPGVTLSDPADLATIAAFTQPGIYTLALYAYVGEQIVDWDTVEIRVEVPDVVVDATVNGQDEYWQLGNNAIGLALDGTVTGAGSGLDYAWSVEGGDSSFVTIVPGTLPAATADINGAGHYVLRLEARYGGQTIGWDDVDIILSTGKPVVDPGEYDKVILINTPKELNLEGHVWDDQATLMDNDHIQWTIDGPSDTQVIKNTLTPALSFNEGDEGVYTVTLSYTDADGLNDTKSATVVVEYPTAYVEIGDNVNTVMNYPVYFDEVVVLPPGYLYYYQWEVISATDGATVNDVEFDCDTCMRPEVIFRAPGTYFLELRVYTESVGTDPFGSDTVAVNVEPYILPDDEAPEFITPVVPLSVCTDGYGVNPITEAVCGDIYIHAIVKDEHLDKVLLIRQHNGEDHPLAWLELNVISGSYESPKELECKTILDSHTIPTGEHILKAIAWDRAGHSTVATFTLNNNCSISNFRIDPQTIDDENTEMDFQADISGITWNLMIMKGDVVVHTIYTEHTGNLDLLNYDVTGIFPTNGVYAARIEETAHPDNYAEIPFNVAFGTTPTLEDGLFAGFYKGLKASGDDIDGITIPTSVDDSIFTITDPETDELLARGYHTDFPNNIHIKLEVFDAGIVNMEHCFTYDTDYNIEYLYENWSVKYPEMLLANVTPGVLDEFDFTKMSLGNDGDENLVASFEPIAGVDFSSLEDGIYQLLLTVECRLDDETILVKYDHLEFALNCPLKLGNIKFSQEDITIPVGGYPLRVVRTYDSQTKDKNGEFGYGWMYSLANMDIKLSETRYNGERLGSDFGRDVTLTLPNTGQRVTFTSYMHKEDNYTYTLTYDSPTGVNATLEAVTIDADGNYRGIKTLKYDPGVLGFYPKGLYWQGYAPLELAIRYGITTDLWRHDTAGFDLKLEDGTVYHIKRAYIKTGYIYDYVANAGKLFEYPVYGKPYLQSIELSSGETIWFDVDTTDGEKPVAKNVKYYPAGVDPQRGASNEYTKSVMFAFDETKGHIIAVYPPSELVEDTINGGWKIDASSVSHVKYEYDAWGNLEKVHKLIDRAAAEYETITFVYEDLIYRPQDHYVTEIRDPRGLAPIRYVYDEYGKLVATIDARGNRIEINHDMVNNLEEVTDRSGNKTIYYYDAHGNVTIIEKFDALENRLGRTEYVFGNTAYPNSPTQVKVALVDNPTSDEDYSITTTRYDSKGQPVLTIDPMLNATETTYVTYGNVDKVATVIQWQPDNASASFPPEYPGSGSPSNYTQLTTTRNFYNGDGTLLIAGCVTTGEEPSLTVHSMTLNYYDGQNKLTATVNVNVDYFATSGHTINDMFADGTTRSILKDMALLPDAENHVATTYYYDDASGSFDQPYSVSLPHAANDDSPVYQQFSKYDADGRQVVSWSFWDDPDNGVGNDKRILTINDMDGQGRVIRARRIVDTDITNPPTDLDTLINSDQADVILSETVYNSIGQVDIAVGEHMPDEPGTKTVYDYDETGILVEMRTYKPVWTGSGYEDELLNVSQTLYDVDGRTLVTVGPYDPWDTAAKPVGTENVYDEAGRIIETRRWAGVKINLVPFWVDVNGAYGSKGAIYEGTDIPASKADDYVGLKVPKGVTPGNAGDGSIAVGWTVWDGAEDVIPVLGDQLSISRTFYDFAGRTKMTISLDDEGYEQPTGYKYDAAGRQICAADATDYGLDKGADYDVVGSFHKLKQTKLDDLLATDIETLSHVSSTSYIGSRRDSSTDDNGNTTYYIYDDQGRLITTQYPPTDYIDEDGYSVTNDNLYTHVSYDGLGRTKWQTGTVSFTSMPVEGSDSFKENVKQLYYDIAGRLIMVDLPDPETGVAGPVYRYIYDDYGNQAAIIDPLERVTVFEYDHMGRQMVKYMPFKDEDSENILTAEHVYAALPDPLPDAEYRTYDDLGRLETSTDYEGQVTGYFYDIQGRLEYKKYYHSAGDYPGSPAETVHYTYDNLGRMETEESDVRGTTTYHYDVEGNLEQLDTPEGTIFYEYNPITGQKSSTEAVNVGDMATYAHTVYGYDGLGRLASATDTLTSPNLSHTYDYNDVGSRKQMVLANSASPWYEYNAMNRLTRVAHHVSPYAGTGAEPTTLNNFAYSLYANGMRATLTETVDENRTIDYSYDNLNRLKIEQAVKDGTTYGYTAHYTYDLAGNRLDRCLEVISESGGVPVTNYLHTSYAYDPATDRLTEEVHETITGPCAAAMMGDKPIYAYADQTGGRYFQTADGERIGSFKAFWMGLPSKLGRYANVALWSALAAMALLPMLVLMLWRRFRRCPAPVAMPYRLGTQAISILLAFVMVFGPWEFQQLTQADTAYANLSTADWATADRTITYTYDDNGALESKTTEVTSTSVVEEVVSYVYNLQGRQARVITDDDPGSGSNVVEVTDYTYNGSGIRVRAYRFRAAQDLLNTGSEQSSATDKQTTLYLIDPDNPTGYAQTVAELVYNAADPDPASTPASVRSYTIGDDMIAQTDVPGDSTETEYLLYDGHGSTRQLINDAQAVVDSFSYDGYGMRLGNSIQSSTATSLLYTGEHYDTDASSYYLRARWYDPSNGCFNRMDPYAGNSRDPQSLHKYLYCHANPINGIDPSGEFSLTSMMCSLCIRMIHFNMTMGTYVQIAKPFIKAVLGLIIARDWYQGLAAGAEVSALTVGISGSFPFLAKTGGALGVDLVCGRNGHAWFGYGALSTNNNWGASLINIGLSFNTSHSQDYEGRGRAVTLSLSLIPPSFRSQILNYVQTFLPKLALAFAQRQGEIGNFARNIDPQLLAKISSSITKGLSMVFNENASITLWGGDGNSFGFSFAPGFSSFGSSEQVSVSYMWYEQIAPEDNRGADINVLL